MLNHDVYSLLGLCARARKLCSGSELIDLIRKKRVYFVFIAEDASQNTKKKISDKCRFYNVEFQVIGTSIELSHAIGKENRMALGIIDKGFANKIQSMLGG